VPAAGRLRRFVCNVPGPSRRLCYGGGGGGKEGGGGCPEREPGGLAERTGGAPCRGRLREARGREQYARPGFLHLVSRPLKPRAIALEWGGVRRQLDKCPHAWASRAPLGAEDARASH